MCSYPKGNNLGFFFFALETGVCSCFITSLITSLILKILLSDTGSIKSYLKGFTIVTVYKNVKKKQTLELWSGFLYVVEYTFGYR